MLSNSYNKDFGLDYNRSVVKSIKNDNTKKKLF